MPRSPTAPPGAGVVGLVGGVTVVGLVVEFAVVGVGVVLTVVGETVVAVGGVVGDATGLAEVAVAATGRRAFEE
jgi:hypothetical protein